VLWEAGKLKDVPMWYVPDTAHDKLCAQKSAFTGYLDLLTTGKTTRLPPVPSGTRDSAAPPVRFVMPQVPPADSIPSDSDARLFGFSGESLGDVVDQPPVTIIDVSVVHGSLAYVKYPVMVGHYAGDTIVSAEAFLDKQLGGELSRRLALDLYPGTPDRHGVFIRQNPRIKPSGAIVIGLGNVGDLTPALLEESARTALTAYALRVGQWPDDRFGAEGTVRSAAVSCCLIGTGAGQLPVRSSIESILRGAIAANAGLAATKSGAVIDRLEFIEIYEDIALAAVNALHSVLANSDIAKSIRWPVRALREGPGRQRRVRYEEAPEWWQRLEVVEDKDNAGALRFTLIGDRARTEQTLAQGELAEVNDFIRDASGSVTRNAEISRTLFELLLPQRLKEFAPRQREMVLLLDDASARYPWELLEDRWSKTDRPPSVRAGLVRQLKTSTFRPSPAYGTAPKALVIGEPDLEGWSIFPDLIGAREEANRVAQVLAEHNFEVTASIGERAKDVRSALHRGAAGQGIRACGAGGPQEP
jgi:hypothetical protein